MAGPATKQKKTPTPPPPAAGASPTIITVNGGIPTPASVTVGADARIQFINNDNQSYLIRMQNSQGTPHTIAVVLPALSSIALMVDPDTGQATTEYTLSVIVVARGPNTDTGGGGGKIIISS
jgi:hypothetical protein